MKVYVGFSTSDWWVSRVIRWFTRSQVSHAFLLLEDTELGDMILEAGWDGWRLTTRKADIVGTTRIVELIEPAGVTQPQLQAAVMQSLGWLGERYNYEGLLGMAWVAACRWLGKKVRNPLRNSSSMFCSEGALDVLCLVPMPAAKRLDPQSVSPDDLSSFLHAEAARLAA